jgi:hypothetical protein
MVYRPKKWGIKVRLEVQRWLVFENYLKLNTTLKVQMRKNMNMLKDTKREFYVSTSIPAITFYL